MLTSRTPEDVEKTLTRMEKELDRRRPEWETAVKSYLTNLLIMAARYASQRETELPNEQIVYACGLRDIPTFYRQFKSHAGMTPNAYRQGEAPADEPISTQDH